MTFKFDPFFNGVLTPKERMEIHSEAEVEADLDFLRGECARFGVGIDHDRVLSVAVHAAAASLRATGAIDWRAVVVALLGERGADADTTAEALTRMAHQLAEPGSAATKAATA